MEFEEVFKEVIESHPKDLITFSETIRDILPENKPSKNGKERLQ
jgi:hypothetical protein